MENESYRIFGVELSPYSVKVRSYFRYKQIPHEWIIRGPSEMETFQRYAKLPLIPLVVTPEDVGLQDSTPILEEMEKRYPEPSIYPADPVSRFIERPHRGQRPRGPDASEQERLQHDASRGSVYMVS